MRRLFSGPTKVNDDQEYYIANKLPNSSDLTLYLTLTSNILSIAVGPFASPTETYQYFDLPFCQPKTKDNKPLTLGEVSFLFHACLL
jgi:hypothetical protein